MILASIKNNNSKDFTMDKVKSQVKDFEEANIKFSREIVRRAEIVGWLIYEKKFTNQEVADIYKITTSMITKLKRTYRRLKGGVSHVE